MPTSTVNVLQDLRDIHYPEPISWWPLAPGWYLLALGLIVAVAGVIYFFFITYRARARCAKTLERLRVLQAVALHAHSTKAVMELSVLLKQVALKLRPREAVASLHGEAWLAFLDKTGHTQEFSQGPGRLLLSAPYQEAMPTDIQALFQVAERWLRYSNSRSTERKLLPFFRCGAKAKLLLALKGENCILPLKNPPSLNVGGNRWLRYLMRRGLQ